MLIVTTDNRDIYRNLAVEEWLLENTPHLPVLLLYVNSPCVVIGKNQNPWRECRLSLMEKEGVPLARRISGGGAVYHDEGNLNFGVIVPRTEYHEAKQYELIFQTLEKFGIKASKLRKNSLAVDGLKFSGQAFCFRGQHVLHHGTLLVNSDLDRLNRYLGSELEDIETKAVASVPSDVMNLSSSFYNPPRPAATPPVEGSLYGAIPSFGGVPGRRGGLTGLTVEKLSDALIETFVEMYGKDGSAFAKASADRVECWSDADILEKTCAATQLLSSKDWKLNHTPRFQVAINGQTLEIEKGLITNLDGNPPFAEWVKNES